MAIEHADIPLYGVQFHPESILTEAGMDILVNFYSQKVA
jgi:para-aminobenzoate synthetase component 2